MNFIENETAQKLRGGYYTPLDLATYIAKWVVGRNSSSVLEPSCGDGVFAQALANTANFTGKFVGFELLTEEAQKAKARCDAIKGFTTTIHNSDYLEWAIENLETPAKLFDGVVGNPPFIRYQYLNPESQFKAAKIFKILGLPFTKHTNAWVPFVLASMSALRPGGRFGMILPAEIINVMHAQSLRTFFGNECSRLLIIDPEEIWFEDTLQGAVILLAEKKLERSDHSFGLGIKRIAGRKFLNESAEVLFDSIPRMNGKTVIGKWTHALLTEAERELMAELEGHADIHRFKNIAGVDVGIVTGANKFFLVNDETVEKFGLQAYAHPMFGRSDHCRGVIYDEAQHLSNVDKGNPTNFIWLKDLDLESDPAIAAYLELGKEQKLPSRYKCSVRTPWYTVPSVYSTPIGLLKRAHNNPRLIHNEIGAYTTDTAYRITTSHCEPERLVFSFVNSLTALSAELEGRAYGGGVLELVPSEVEKLIVPLPRCVIPDLRELDTAIRRDSPNEVLIAQDRKIFSPIGVSESMQEQLQTAWVRLRSRRQRIPTDDIE